MAQGHTPVVAMMRIIKPEGVAGAASSFVSDDNGTVKASLACMRYRAEYNRPCGEQHRIGESMETCRPVLS